jgi:REP element-mobilizing transposase RayT
MSEDKWHWQTGRIWRGVGIYHVTMVVPSRMPLFGDLVIPDDDPGQAYIARKELGEAILKLMFMIPDYHPEVEIIQFCLMPDHIHFILRVKREMKKGIASVVRGFWQGAKKAGNVYASSVFPNTIRSDQPKWNPIFTEKPFIRPMSRKGQLQSMIRYVQMNPQRLATKRLKPGYFYVQENVEIGARVYSAVGNIQLLHAQKYSPVHVRSMWVKDAEQNGNIQPLRDYKNGCVLAAREGTVMVSPFISEHEKAVLDVLLKEQHDIIYIADNGFGRYFKPSDALFDAVAEGRLLILSPWSYDSSKKRVSRDECVAMNGMAEKICDALSPNTIRKN